MKRATSFETEIDYFVKYNNLQPADVLLVKKLPLKLLKHYIVYLGIYRNKHIFMANTFSGVKVFSYNQLMIELQTFQPEKIERFIGSENERANAVQRAINRKDENSYNLLLNNCEHYKNWVHKGVSSSEQAKTAGITGIAIGAGLAIGAKSDGEKLMGIGLLLLGGLAWAFGDEDNATAIPQHLTPSRF